MLRTKTFEDFPRGWALDPFIYNVHLYRKIFIFGKMFEEFCYILIYICSNTNNFRKYFVSRNERQSKIFLITLFKIDAVKYKEIQNQLN